MPMDGLQVIQPLTNKEITRFWSKVNINDDKSCWEWKCYIDSSGYGVVGIHCCPVKAHRVAFHITHPKWDQKSYVLHKCDNPKCCNPKHLFAGTAADNAHDRDTKGRGRPPHIQGSKHHSAVLTEKDVITIRKLYNKGMTQSAIGTQFNIRQYHVSKIVTRREWQHI